MYNAHVIDLSSVKTRLGHVNLKSHFLESTPQKILHQLIVQAVLSTFAAGESDWVTNYHKVYWL